MSYELKMDPKKRAGSRFMGEVRKALIMAAVAEKEANGLNQQQLAERLGVNRSVVNRMLKGESNLTLRSVGEIAWALGWKPQFRVLPKASTDPARNFFSDSPRVSSSTSSIGNIAVFSNEVRAESHGVKFLEAAE